MPCYMDDYGHYNRRNGFATCDSYNRHDSYDQQYSHEHEATYNSYDDYSHSDNFNSYESEDSIPYNQTRVDYHEEGEDNIDETDTGWQCCICLTFYSDARKYCPRCNHDRDHPGLEGGPRRSRLDPGGVHEKIPAADGGHCRPAGLRWECCQCGSDNSLSAKICLKITGYDEICSHKRSSKNGQKCNCCRLRFYEAYNGFWLCCVEGCHHRNKPEDDSCQKTEKRSILGNPICGHKRVHKRKDGRITGECNRGVNMWLCRRCGTYNNFLLPTCVAVRKEGLDDICGNLRPESAGKVVHFRMWRCNDCKCLVAGNRATCLKRSCKGTRKHGIHIYERALGSKLMSDSQESTTRTETGRRPRKAHGKR